MAGRFGKDNKTSATGPEPGGPSKHAFASMPLRLWSWRAYFLVGMVALLVAGTLWYTLRTGNYIAKMYSPLAHGAMEIRLELTTGHLWFEEMLSGDRNKDVSAVWSHLDTSIWYARAMCRGGQNGELTFIGTEDSALPQRMERIVTKIEQFRSMAEKRMRNPGNAQAGSEIDQQFDSLFESIMLEVKEVERGFQKSMAEDLLWFHKVLTGLIVACFCLAFLVVLILHRFEKRKALDLHALLVSERKFRTYVDNALNIVCLVDDRGRFLEVNEASCQSTGYSETELLSMSCLDLVPTDSLIRARARLGILARKGRIHFEQRCRRKDGTDLYLSLDAVRIDDDRYMVCCSDVTERRRSEEALKESEEKYRLIAERAFDVIITTERDGIITYASPSIERVFGYMARNVVGKRFTDLTPDQNVPWIAKSFELTGSGKIAENHMSQLRRVDGSIADVEINAVPIKKGDAVLGTQAIIRDVTETRRLREQESRAHRLETAGRIAGQVAHDFNNLLAPLMGYPELIRDKLSEDHPVLPLLGRMEKSASQIADINQQLLTLGRRGHYNLEPVNLNDVISDILSEIGPLPDLLICRTDLCNDLMNVMGGGAQIHRVILNLLHNARDAMSDEGTILIRTENYYIDEESIVYGKVPRGEYVKLTLTDSGCGIPDGLLQTIFDPFVTSKTTDKKRGSGLGLSVVDAVVKDHDGYIDLSTEVGKGTSFYLYFPVTREAIDEPDPSLSVGGSESILVVDDDEVQREVCSQLLMKLGYDVTVVDGGERAIEYLAQHGCDLLILDMVMPPGIDGAETYRQAAQLNPNQRAIIVSGFSLTDRVAFAQSLGAGAFVRKPFTGKSIAAAVRKEIDREQKVPV